MQEKQELKPQTVDLQKTEPDRWWIRVVDGRAEIVTVRPVTDQLVETRYRRGMAVRKSIIQ